MPAAKSIGYASCSMDGFDFDAVSNLVNLLEEHVVAMFVAIGKGAKDAYTTMREGALPADRRWLLGHRGIRAG